MYEGVDVGFQLAYHLLRVRGGLLIRALGALSAREGHAVRGEERERAGNAEEAPRVRARGADGDRGDHGAAVEREEPGRREAPRDPDRVDAGEESPTDDLGRVAGPLVRGGGHPHRVEEQGRREGPEARAGDPGVGRIVKHPPEGRARHEEMLGPAVRGLQDDVARAGRGHDENREEPGRRGERDELRIHARDVPQQQQAGQQREDEAPGDEGPPLRVVGVPHAAEADAEDADVGQEARGEHRKRGRAGEGQEPLVDADEHHVAAGHAQEQVHLLGVGCVFIRGCVRAFCGRGR